MDSLDPKQLRAIELLVQGHTMVAVAAEVGVCTRTLRRWKHEPEFAAELRACSEEVRENVQFKLWAKIQQDFDCASANMDWLGKLRDQCPDPRVCLRAAQIMIDQTFKWARFMYSRPVAEALSAPAQEASKSGQMRTNADTLGGTGISPEREIEAPHTREDRQAPQSRQSAEGSKQEQPPGPLATAEMTGNAPAPAPEKKALMKSLRLEQVVEFVVGCAAQKTPAALDEEVRELRAHRQARARATSLRKYADPCPRTDAPKPMARK